MTMPPQEQLDAFATWLEDNGATVEPPTNPYEAVRFRRDGRLSVLYRKANGSRGRWTGDAERAWACFRKGRPWPTENRPGGTVPVLSRKRGRMDWARGEPWSGFWATCHTDMSGSPSHPPMAWAGWIKSGEGALFPGGPCPDDCASTTDGELHGMVSVMAEAFAAWPNLDGVLVVCDNREAVRLLAGDLEPRSDLQRDLVARGLELLGERWAVWRWQKGHRADGSRSAYVNRTVDRLAKRRRRQKGARL